MSGLECFVDYPYYHPDRPDEVAMWQIRASRIADGSKLIWYRRPCRSDSQDWRRGDDGKPEAALADGLLYNLSSLREAIERNAPAVFWCEGEKDCTAADELLCEAGRGMQLSATMAEGPAVSHHGGAGKATPQQAEHFRGYRGLVYVAVDWDDAGAACGLARYKLLRAVGVRVRLVRPADGALAVPLLQDGLSGGGGRVSAADRYALEAWSAELGLPALPSGGADLTDHLDSGYGLGDLVRLRPGDLAPAADRHRAREASGWRYGSPEDRELWANSPWAREKTQRSRGQIVIA